METLALSYLEHGILPGPGNLLDQDERLMSDVRTWLSEYFKIRRELQAPLEFQG